jgi:predicted RNA binding protein YcfA (HicA-like mRNA interferase family)
VSPSLRNVRQEQAVKAFVSAGGVERTGKGSHRVVKMPNGKLISLPAGVLKTGLLRHQIKLAGLSEEEFDGLLK